MKRARLIALCLGAFIFGLGISQNESGGQEGSADKPVSHYMTCAEECNKCQRACDSCSLHCMMKLAEGKKEHQMPLRTCQDCATHCAAAAAIVARQGPMSETICKACEEACLRCAKECEKHAHDHQMKKCAEACRSCERACQDMLKHVRALKIAGR